MINNVSLHNFKCHADANFVLKSLTLLTGVNGVGKSSFIQALLAMHQTAMEGQLQGHFVTNGMLVNLGLVEDVMYENAEDAKIRIGFCMADACYAYEFMRDKDYFVALAQSDDNEPFTDFSYLCAERFGPRVSFPIPTSDQSYCNRIGNRGEFAAYTLAMHGEETIECTDLLLEDFPDSLLAQTEAWLSKLGRTLRIHIDNQPHMDSINLQYSYLRGKLFSRQYRASNVGFGITYTLPIIVAVLSAVPGELIIIENPEAHLHPKGQAIIGEFLALAAQSGIQIIVETHSDHVLNGIRVAVKRKKLTPENLAVHFFSCSDDGSSYVYTPQIDTDGRFDTWPDDFFDEWDKQLAELIGD